MEDEKRSNILEYATWVNPYTNEEEQIDIFLPKECLNRNIKEYFKKSYDIEINDLDKFLNFLSVLGKDQGDLSDFSDLMDICLMDYYKTPFYEEDKRVALDEYEMLNNLGEYAETDDYVE